MLTILMIDDDPDVIASACREMCLLLVLVGRVKKKLLEDGLLESAFVTKRG